MIIAPDKLKEILLKNNNITEHNQIFRYIDEQLTVEVKEQILAELESTRYIECPYPQCDEMYHAWNEAFDAMEKVVKQLLDNDLTEV